MKKFSVRYLGKKNFFPNEVQKICLHVVQTKQLCLYEVYIQIVYICYRQFFCLYYIQTIRIRMIKKKSKFLLNIGSLYYTVKFIQQVALLLPLGTLIPHLLLLFRILVLIFTQALIYIYFEIAPNISNFPDKVSLLAIATNNTVFEPHFFYGVACC